MLVKVEYPRESRPLGAPYNGHRKTERRFAGPTTSNDDIETLGSKQRVLVH